MKRYTSEELSEAIQWANAQAEMLKGIPAASEPWAKVGAMLFDLQASQINRRGSDVAPLVEAVRAYESECANPVMDPVLKRQRREAMFAALTTIDAQERGV